MLWNIAICDVIDVFKHLGEIILTGLGDILLKLLKRTDYREKNLNSYSLIYNESQISTFDRFYNRPKMKFRKVSILYNELKNGQIFFEFLGP